MAAGMQTGIKSVNRHAAASTGSVFRNTASHAEHLKLVFERSIAIQVYASSISNTQQLVKANEEQKMGR